MPLRVTGGTTNINRTAASKGADFWGDPSGQPPQSFAFGPFVLVPERQLLLRGETPLRIGGRALDILTALVERPGVVIGKHELIARVWKDVVVDEGSLKVNMATLRRTLGDDPGAAQYIATVTGRGYRFVADVQAGHSRSTLLDDAPTDRRLHNLPTGTTRIFGRADVIEAIGHELEASRLVSVVGSGGVGKTTVALAVAERAIGSFKDGVWLVDLALLKEPDLVPDAIATAIGLAVNAPDMLAALCEYLRDRQMLLVVDNCEHLVDAVAACLAAILARVDSVRVLVTSRETLELSDERVRWLTGLETPAHADSLSADEALAFPAIQLFVERASDRLESFRLSDLEAPMVGDICRKLDGLALAIELAATRVDVFGVSGLLKQLETRLDALAKRRGGPERQRTLMATLDWSFGLLSSFEAELLCLVSVFAGVFDVDGAAAVANVPAVDAANALAVLASKSLLATDVDADRVAYRLLETTRAYCLERLGRSKGDDAARRRHAEHVCIVLERAAIEWPQRPAREWGLSYGRYLDDLRGALVWAGRDVPNTFLRIRLTLAGVLLWNHFSLTEACRVQVARALDDLAGAGLTGTATEMRLQVWLGGAMMFTHGPLPPAKAAMERALDIAIQLGDVESRIRCLRLIGVHDLFTGEHESGICTLQEFLEIASAEVPTAVLEAEVAIGIGELMVGRLRDVRERFERRHAADFRDFQDLQSVRYHLRYLSDRMVDVGNVLGHAQWLTGAPDAAIRTARETIEHAIKRQHHLSLCNALSWLASVFFWTGLHAECERCVAMLDEASLRHGFAVRRPVVMLYRAAMASERPDASDDVVEDFRSAIKTFLETGHTVRLPYYLGLLAQCLAGRGHHDEAEVTVQTALERAEVKNERWCLPELLRIRALVHVHRGQLRAAEELLHRSMTVARGIDALSWQLRSANDLAKLLLNQSRTREARAMLMAVYTEFDQGFETRDLTVAADLLVHL
jgi:predicted ATPase/DNA-binding winged helix-turn-helix (wHTH) protein